MRSLQPVLTCLFLCCAILLFNRHGLYAQTAAPAGAVQGRVTEAGSGAPLGGVTVVEVNDNDRQINATNTDNSGNYSLRVADPKNSVRFSFIGYTTVTQQIGNRTVINIALREDSSRHMEDVVIVGISREQVSTGYGSQSKRDLIGAVSSVKGEVLANQPQTSIDQMLQGRAAGVQVVSNSGDPGAGVDIRIRGAGSISAGNDPLYIVDGIPIISTPFERDAIGGQSSVARINPIADINPSDIDRIDILKDANAAAIYGARAANGVIIITTKRGRRNVTNITINSQVGWQQAPPSIPVLNGSQYKIMRLEAEQNYGNINPSNATLLPLVDDPTYALYQYYQSNTNWLSYLRQTGFSHRHTLTVSGGGEAMRYSFSTNYANSQGSFINTGNIRFSSRFNLDYKVSTKLRFSASIFFARSKVNNYANYQGQSVYYMGLARTSALPVFDLDVNGNQLPNYYSLPGVHGSMDNPVAFAKTSVNDAYSTNLKPNIRTEFDILRNLKFVSTASIDFVAENGKLFLPPEATGLIWNDQNFNRIDNRDNERQQFIFNNLLTYSTAANKKLRKTFIIGSEFNTLNTQRLDASGYATPSAMVQTLGSAAGIRSLTSSRSRETILSYFLKADLIYDDTYGFNVTVRRDGSSKFGDANKYGNFPSVGGFWRISNLPAVKDLTFISNLKLRATWGQLGNSGIGNYAYISQFTSGANYLSYNGVSQTNPQLTDLRWETIESTNLGLDMEFFKSRLNVTVDWYKKLTKDLLFTLPMPSSSGLTSGLLTNLGNIQNKGVELDISLDVIRPEKPTGFRWNTSFNMGRNINKVTALPGGTLLFSNSFARFAAQVKQGDALGTYYGLVYKGVYATDADAAVKDAKGQIVYELDGITPKIIRLTSETGPLFKGGDAIYEDFNHDGVINDQDRILIGNANADFFGGLNNSFDYKNFSLRFFIQFQYGNDIINGMRYNLESMINADNQAITTLQRWRKQGDITNMPRALSTDNRNNVGSTRWIEDGSYARLKFVTLTYSFKPGLVKKLRLKGVDAFFTANNLYTWTDYTGADPEIVIGNNPAFIGVDSGLTPQTRGYTFGVNVRF